MAASPISSSLARLVLAFLVVACVSCVEAPQYLGNVPGGGRYRVQQKYHSKEKDGTWGLVKIFTPRSGAKLSTAPPVPPYFWRGEGVTGSPRIVIDLSEQRARFYKGDLLVGDSPVCTGSAKFPTPRGRFSVIEKDEDHFSSVYGDYVDKEGSILRSNIDRRKDRCPSGGRFNGAKMYWFMRLVGGVGMHEGYLPGYADSHGCIRLPSKMARAYYLNAPYGTPVTIVQ